MFITTQMRSVFQKELPHSKMNNTLFSVGTILTQMLFYTLIAKYYIAMHICIFVVFGHIFNLIQMVAIDPLFKKYLNELLRNIGSFITFS